MDYSGQSGVQFRSDNTALCETTIHDYNTVLHRGRVLQVDMSTWYMYFISNKSPDITYLRSIEFA